MHSWWPEKPVLELPVVGSIASREQALATTQAMVDDIEASSYKHVIVILDLSKMERSPSATALLAGALPKTDKIEHLVIVGAPFLFKMAAAPLVHLRNKIHFVDNAEAGRSKATGLISKLPA